MTVLTKRIEPVFRLDGTRRFLIGFDGFLDGTIRVFCAANYVAAEHALDELAYDLLVSEADLDAEADAYRSEAH